MYLPKLRGLSLMHPQSNPPASRQRQERTASELRTGQRLIRPDLLERRPSEGVEAVSPAVISWLEATAKEAGDAGKEAARLLKREAHVVEHHHDQR